jgi:DNA replication and repair protein RecF
MQIERLVLKQLRRFEEIELAPRPGLNLIVGENGAGKTSVLEALHLMAYGRSFRGRVRDGLVRQGSAALEVFVQWREPAGPEPGRVRKAGLRHSGQAWTGRLDGEPVTQLGDLCAALAVVSFEPGSHELIAGGAEHRRRFLDWGLFHVEHEFLRQWRRYSRALRQRNALLKSQGGDAQLDAWDHELAESGELVTRYRQSYLSELHPGVLETAARLTAGVEIQSLELSPGWRQHEMGLHDALLLARPRDRLAGFTGVGPHRADWNLRFQGLPGRDALSRGQTKLVALAMLLGQAADYARRRGHWPVVALDDLPSELDSNHQQRVLAYLLGQPGLQLFVTATEVPRGWEELAPPECVFHVEQGRLQA